MRSFFKQLNRNNEALLFYFMAAWVLLNGVQAALVHIDGDEAYYWLYARQLDWGYFDHPPLVALSIKVGELLRHGPFFTRLGTILFSAGTLYFGFKLLPPRLANVRLYLLLFSSVALFHVYGFIATPDAPLLFFTTLFFYAYRRFLTAQTAAQILIVALSIAGLLYSKYQGVLPIFFTLLSNPKLLRSRPAWLAVLLASLAFAPYIWWQYQHHWPTLRYHLSERMSDSYDVSRTGVYVLGQLLIWGVSTMLPALYLFIKQKRKTDVYERAHRFTFWGVLGFFLLSTWRSDVQLHWTLIAGPSFVVLLLQALDNASSKWKRLFNVLLCINIVLILLARVLFVIPNAAIKSVPAFKMLADSQSWTNVVYSFARGRPVVFTDSYQMPAVYMYHHPDAKAWGYNTVNYRKTQFNIFSDHFLNNASVCIAGPDSQPDSSHILQTPYNTLYLRRIDSFKAVNALHITWQNPLKKTTITKKDTTILLLVNTGNDTIRTTGLSVNHTFFKNNIRFSMPALFCFPELVFPPHFKKEITLSLQPPKEAGAYTLVFSIVQRPLAGNFASSFYKIVVE